MNITVQGMEWFKHTLLQPLLHIFGEIYFEKDVLVGLLHAHTKKPKKCWAGKKGNIMQ